MIKKILLISTLFSVLYCGPLENAIDSYNKKDFNESFPIFSQLALSGDSVAMYNLGLSFYHGYGTEKDFKKASYWYEKAAVNGIAYAQNNLAHMYQFGEGVGKDDVKALNWYQKAAKQNLPVSYLNLALYYEAKDTKQSYKSALEWYKKASLAGVVVAQNNLAKLYFNGPPDIKNPAEGIKWLQIGASNGNELAMYNLANSYLYADGVKKNVDEALKYYLMSSEKDYVGAIVKLGDLYRTGEEESIPVDFKKSLYFYAKAASKSDKAKYYLGYQYLNGLGVDKNKEEGLFWMKEASNAGNKKAKDFMEKGIL